MSMCYTVRVLRRLTETTEMAPKLNSRGSEREDPAAKRLRTCLLREVHSALGLPTQADELLSLTQKQWRSVASTSALLVGDFARVNKGEITDEAMSLLIAQAEADMALMERPTNCFDREYMLEKYNHKLVFLRKLKDSQLGSDEVFRVLRWAISLDPHTYFACVPGRGPFRHRKFKYLAELAAQVHPRSWEAIPSYLRTKEHMCAAARKFPAQLGSMDVPNGMNNWWVVEAALLSDMGKAMEGLEAEHRKRLHITHSETFADHPYKVIRFMPPKWRGALDLTGTPNVEEANRRMKEALLGNPKANLRWVCEERPDLLDSEVRAAFLRTHWEVLGACCSECGAWYPEEWWVGLIWRGPENMYNQHGYGINAVEGQCTGQQVMDHARRLGFDTAGAELCLGH